MLLDWWGFVNLRGGYLLMRKLITFLDELILDEV